MTASNTAIANTAAKYRRDYPHVTTGSNLFADARTDLESLAEGCGLPTSAIYRATANDLIGIYLVALKDPAGAKRVAAKVAMRLDPALGGLLEEPEPPKPVAPKPPAAAPESPTRVDLATIRAIVKEEVQEGALEPLQAHLDQLDQDTLERFGGLRARIEQAETNMAEQARAAAVEALKSLTPTRLEITRQGEPPHALGLVHRDTAKIIGALSAGVNVYLHGPAGSGKTTVARKCAEAFGLQFYFAAKVESEYQLIGFKDAKGDTVRTPFRDAYEHGGVFLFDEMDASSPSAVVALNAALANGICPFPDAIVQRHKDFYAIGAGNTKLTGANRQYAGRNQLDAASIDRFAFIEFGYDDELEKALATDQAWCAYVQGVRAAITERGLNHLVTPRATYDGCRLLAQGFDWDTVSSMCVYKGLDADTVAQIERAAPARRRA